MTLTESPRVHTSVIPPAPRASVRATVAAGIVQHALRNVPVRLQMPGGKVMGAGGADAPTMQVIRPDAFLSRLGADVKIGFGEAYLAGDWAAAPGTDLADLLTPFAERIRSIVPRPVQWLRRYVEPRIPILDHNTKPGARRNVERHYDLSNEMFAAFLDETMTYSAGWFPDDLSAPGASDLTAAQVRKVDGILDLAGVRAGMSVVEIGTGWGFLAIRAAQRGATVTSTTLSGEQLALARTRVAAAGLADQVELLHLDFRDLTGTYDALVSVEMVEAVGPKLWPEYFATVDRLLKPGGRAGLQTITMPHDQMLATTNAYGWIQKYVFPGGLIPSLDAIETNLAAHTSLYVAERRDLRLHYVETLRQWRARFLESWDQVAALGFDEPFRRLWELYLAYSEAGFRSGYLGVSQLALARPPSRG